MKIYASIAISDQLWSTIRTEMTAYASIYCNDLDNPSVIKNAIEINASDFLKHVNSFDQFLKEHNLTIASMFLMITRQVGPHVDFSHGCTTYHDFKRKQLNTCLSTNWPVKNGEHSKTVFYEPADNFRSIVKGNYLGFYQDGLKEIDYYVLDRPMIMRSDIIHSIKVFSDTPRISYSIRYTKDPIELLKH